MTTNEHPTRTSGLARQFLLLRALAARVAEGQAIVKNALIQSGFAPGTTTKPLLPDGRHAGRVEYTAPEPKAVLVDPKAFGEWVRDNYPKNVDMSWLPVYEAFTKSVLFASTQAGQPCGPGGEVGDRAPAGIVVVAGSPVLRAIHEKTLAAELWAEIRADPDGLLQLPADPAEPAGGA
jgi:hypothetical protein